MSRSSDYLTAQVLTAAPQKLHLMLIDGAIRFAQQAKQVWEDDAKRQAREEALTRCVKITGELLAGMRASNLPAGKQFTAVYAWLFRTVTEAKLLGDQRKLDEALELLAIERETWRQVCEKFGSQLDSPAATSPASRDAVFTTDPAEPVTSLSLEA